MSKDSKYGQTAKVLSFNPTGEYYFNKGLKAYHQRDLYKAKKFLERAQNLEPLEPVIACQLAIVCTDLGDYADSNRLLDKIIKELDPYMTECHYFLANNFAHQGLFKDAYKHASEYLKKEAYGEFTEEAEDLLDLITLENNDTEESLYEQDSLISEQEEARKHLESGNFKKAAEVLRATIENHPDFWFAYNNLALAYFYMGRTKDAFATLEDVLLKNPGNLHALCNLAVFHHYGKNVEAASGILSSLKKVRPILFEQQYKLATTFALLGEYEEAYKWLRSLHKKGFEGDETFYYWLSNCACQLGLLQSSQKAWKRVLEFNPSKEGMEPWKNAAKKAAGNESWADAILKNLQSSERGERLFGLFLAKHMKGKEKVKEHTLIRYNPLFTDLEEKYAAILTASAKPSEEIRIMDEAAEQLLSRYQPAGSNEDTIFKLLFSVLEQAEARGQQITNPSAWAAAVRYIWHQQNGKRISQQYLAEEGNVSVSTLRKYIKLVKELL